MPNGMALDAHAPGSAGAPPVIVMGLDQHRAQITAEWLDTATGEIGRARIAPAHRAGVRKFLGRFRGLRLEAALEATTGWRFVVEELAAVGAVAHLAEPAETSARRGNKKRAKTDRSDARHLRELLMAGRLPESWIAPAHLLDLRAQVRLRHALVNQRGEWQQRVQAVLYHHGLPQRGALLRRESRAWLMPLPPRQRGRPQKTERPQPHQRELPDHHHVPGPPHGQAADRDKHGHPHAPHQHHPTRTTRPKRRTHPTAT